MSQRIRLRRTIGILAALLLAGCTAAETPSPPAPAREEEPTRSPIPPPDIDTQTLSELQGSLEFKLDVCGSSNWATNMLVINAPTTPPSSRIATATPAPLPVNRSISAPPPTETPTPAPPAQCPPSSDSLVINPAEWDVLDYLDAGGPVDGLAKLLNWRRRENCPTGPTKNSWNNATVFHTDLTGDAVPDVLIVQIGGWNQWKSSAVHGVTFSLFYCHNGQYEGSDILFAPGSFADFPPVLLDPNQSVWAIQDLNGNGLPEIVLSHVSPPTVTFEVHGATRHIHIMEWDGDRMAHLVDLNGDLSGTPNAISFAGDGRLADVDGNGTIELVVMNYARCLEDEDRQVQLEIYAWDGYHFSLAHSEPLAQPSCD